MYSAYAYSEAAYSEILATGPAGAELAGAAAGVASATGDLTTGIQREGDASGVGSGTGTLGDAVELGGDAQGTATAQGTLSDISRIRYNAPWSMQSATPKRRFMSYSSSMPRRVIH
jgi:hypothetical protein